MKNSGRRQFLETGAVAAAAAGLASAAEPAGTTLALGNRIHFSAHPDVKEKLTHCFSSVLGCGDPIRLNATGLAEPILAFRFPNGGSLSVEFTPDALTESQMRHGAWVEIWSGDRAALEKKVLEAGLTRIHYPATNTFYFMAPGGLVIGIVPDRNQSAGELKVKP